MSRASVPGLALAMEPSQPVSDRFLGSRKQRPGPGGSSDGVWGVLSPRLYASVTSPSGSCSPSAPASPAASTPASPRLAVRHDVWKGTSPRRMRKTPPQGLRAAQDSLRLAPPQFSTTGRRAPDYDALCPKAREARQEARIDGEMDARGGIRVFPEGLQYRNTSPLRTGSPRAKDETDYDGLVSADGWRLGSKHISTEVRCAPSQVGTIMFTPPHEDKEEPLDVTISSEVHPHLFWGEGASGVLADTFCPLLRVPSMRHFVTQQLPSPSRQSRRAPVASTMAGDRLNKAAGKPSSDFWLEGELASPRQVAGQEFREEGGQGGTDPLSSSTPNIAGLAGSLNGTIVITEDPKRQSLRASLRNSPRTTAPSTLPQSERTRTMSWSEVAAEPDVGANARPRWSLGHGSAAKELRQRRATISQGADVLDVARVPPEEQSYRQREILMHRNKSLPSNSWRR